MNWQPGKQPIMGGHRIAERLAEVERQLAELKKFIQVSQSEVVIKSPGTVKIEANMEAQVRGGAGVKIEAPAQVRIEAGLLMLPGGARPVVRVGDVVAGPAGSATITGPGNPLILG